tara:strand:- start:3349 stop:3885 length:537 start_codon:yes stop_codon:yes gene_type:complete
MNDFKLRVMKHVSAELREHGKNQLRPVLYIKTRLGKHRIVPVPYELLASEESKNKLKEIMIYINKVTKSECCCFVAECRIGAGNDEDLKKVLTPEEYKIFRTGELTKELYEKVRENSEYLDGVFLQFEHADNSELNEFMGFEVLEDGMMKPYKHSEEAESPLSVAQKNLSGRFMNLYQ